MSEKKPLGERLVEGLKEYLMMLENKERGEYIRRIEHAPAMVREMGVADGVDTKSREVLLTTAAYLVSELGILKNGMLEETEGKLDLIAKVLLTAFQQGRIMLEESK